MSKRFVGLALSAAVFVVAACGHGNATGPGPVVAPTDSDAAALPASAPAASVTAEPAADAAAAPTGPKLCGCGLCEPLFSDDACTTDADCAPSSLCHAEACVAKAKAPARQPNATCTQIMKCATADANACGCVQGRCALAPRAKR